MDIENQGILDLGKEDGSVDYEELLDMQNSNYPSPLPNNNLQKIIKAELSLLESQLTQINEKLRSNQDSLLLKRVENEEMRKLIDYYNMTTETKVQESCSCSNKCLLL